MDVRRKKKEKTRKREIYLLQRRNNKRALAIMHENWDSGREGEFTDTAEFLFRLAVLERLVEGGVERGEGKRTIVCICRRGLLGFV